MSRLKFKMGQLVAINGAGPFLIEQVQPALELPYLLSDGTWRDESSMMLREADIEWEVIEWEVIEEAIKNLVGQLSKRFADHNENHMTFSVRASGRPDGDIKIQYAVGDAEYSDVNKVKGYSLRPTLEEMFRRKSWNKRNAPLMLSASGDAQEAI